MQIGRLGTTPQDYDGHRLTDAHFFFSTAENHFKPAPVPGFPLAEDDHVSGLKNRLSRRDCRAGRERTRRALPAPTPLVQKEPESRPTPQSSGGDRIRSPAVGGNAAGHG